MIKKLKIGLLIAVLSAGLGISAVAHATDAITYTDDTTVTVGAYNYTIVGGSTATSVAVGAADLTVIMPSGSTFTLTSADRKLLGTDQASGYSSTCGASISTTVLHQTTGSPVTFVIAPTGDCTPVTSGGGGGGGVVDITPPTNTSISINAGATTISSLSATLTLVATDATQMLISNDASFTVANWETYATSKAWTLTSGDGLKTVYAKFKDAAGNMSAVASDTITVSGTGTIAPPVTPPETGGCPASTHSGLYNFGTKTLKNGSRGEAVKELQRFLNAKLCLGLVIDGKLGPKTIAVIKKWQKAHSLVVDGLIGPKTKAKMNAEAN